MSGGIGDHKESQNGTRRQRRNGNSEWREALGGLFEQMTRLADRLAAVEAVLSELRQLQQQRLTEKEHYTTAEVALLLGKRPYTVREWCRLGRINAEKANFGRGLDEEWRISHNELLRIQNEGLLPLKKFSEVAAPKRLPK